MHWIRVTLRNVNNVRIHNNPTFFFLLQMRRRVARQRIYKTASER